MSRGHDPLDSLSVGELRKLAAEREIESKGLGKDELVRLVRADIGGARPEKVVRDPLEDMPSADLKDVRRSFCLVLCLLLALLVVLRAGSHGLP